MKTVEDVLQEVKEAYNDKRLCDALVAAIKVKEFIEKKISIRSEHSSFYPERR